MYIPVYQLSLLSIYQLGPPVFPFGLCLFTMPDVYPCLSTKPSVYLLSLLSIYQLGPPVFPFGLCLFTVPGEYPCLSTEPPV
jgi:hypothetical protein